MSVPFSEHQQLSEPAGEHTSSRESLNQLVKIHTVYEPYVPATQSIRVMSDDEARIQRIIEAKRLVLERDEVRSQGNYLKSDMLRDQLKAMGVEVIDQKNG